MGAPQLCIGLQQYLKKMIVVILAIVVMALGLHFWLKYFVRPKRLMKWYKETLQTMGYKVLCFPYEPFKIMLLQNQKHNERQYKDAFHDQKHSWKNYDIILSNTSYMITLIIIQPRLLKYLFAPEKINIIQRSHLNKYGFKIALGNTMILNQGDVWKRKRKVLSEIFNFDFIKRNVPRMREICKEMVLRMEKASEVEKKGSEEVEYKVELKKMFGDMISNIVIRIFFGGEGVDAMVEGVSINKYLSAILKDAKDQSTDVLVLLLGEKAYHLGLRKKYRELKSRLKKLRDEVKSIIRKRMERINEKTGSLQKYTDIFQAMCILKSNGQKDLSPLDEDQIIQEFCAFMAAGNDSTSLFTNMLMYYICEHPEVQAKLREQILKHIKNEEDVTFANLRKIEYLEWVQLETTRMYGPATSIFLREAVKDTTIDNIPILKGVGLKMELLPNHYNEKYFKNPLKFDPQRWRDNEEEIQPFSYGGFSFGARTCLGKHLAYLASKLIVVMMLKRYKKIEIDKKSEIRFELRGFYTPSPFFSILTKSSKNDQE